MEDENEDKEFLESLAAEMQKYLPEIRVKVTDDAAVLQPVDLKYRLQLVAVIPTLSPRAKGLINEKEIAVVVFKNGNMYVVFSNIIIKVDLSNPDLDLEKECEKINLAYGHVKEDMDAQPTICAVRAAAIVNPQIRKMMNNRKKKKK